MELLYSNLKWNQQRRMKSSQMVRNRLPSKARTSECPKSFRTTSRTGKVSTFNKLRFPRENKVHPEGFEPPTLGSEDRCSIQLSYGCVLKFSDWLGYGLYAENQRDFVVHSGRICRGRLCSIRYQWNYLSVIPRMCTTSTCVSALQRNLPTLDSSNSGCI